MYRINVGIVLINNKKQVLLGKRVNYKTFAWQMPQGGIDQNEEPIESVFRELKEEVGTNNIIIIKELQEWIKYDFPKDIKINYVNNIY